MKKTPSLASLAPSSKPLIEKKKIGIGENSVNKLTSEQVKEVEQPATTKRLPTSELVQVAVRMTKRQRRDLKKLAGELDMTIQDVVMLALQEFRERRGSR